MSQPEAEPSIITRPFTAIVLLSQHQLPSETEPSPFVASPPALAEENVVEGLANDNVIQNQPANANEQQLGGNEIEEPPQRYQLSQEDQMVLSIIAASGDDDIEEQPAPADQSLVLPNSLDDFKTAPQPEQPNKRERESSLFEDTPEEQATSCPVCLEVWATSGAHRVVSLPCGHLFGKSCIEKWLGKKNAKCPSCQKPSKRADIRPLFVRQIIAVDSSELDQTKQKFAALQHERDHLKMQYEMAKDSAERLRKELAAEKLRSEQLLEQITLQARSPTKKVAISPPSRTSASSVTTSTSSTSPTSTSSASATTINTSPTSSSPPLQTGLKFVLQARANCEKGARSFDFDRSRRSLVTAKLMPNGSAALVKFLLNDPRISDSFVVHDKQVRDIECSSRGDGTVLTASLDKTVRLSNLDGKVVIQRWAVEAPAWSCCWDSSDSNLLYCGLANGVLMSFDVRRTHQHLARYNVGEGKAIHSLKSLPSEAPSTPALFVGTMGNAIVVESTTGNASKGAAREGFGQCISTSFDNISKNFLATFRQGEDHRACHMIGGINVVRNEPFALSEFGGLSTQKLMTRTDVFTSSFAGPSKVYVAAPDEANSMVCLYDVQSKATNANLQVSGGMLQVKHFRASHQEFIGALSDTTLHVFKAM